MTTAEEQQWKEVWNLYDLDNDSKITKAEFLSAVRVCGRRYTAEQMADKTKTFGDTVSYDTYFGFLCDPYSGPTPADLTNALRAFDGADSGALTSAQIQSLLTSMGDKMTNAEVKPLLEALPLTNGKIDIERLATFLTPPVPSTKPNIPELMREIMAEESSAANLPKPPSHPPTPVAAPLSPPAAAAPVEGGAPTSDDDDDLLGGSPTIDLTADIEAAMIETGSDVSSD